MADFEAHQTYIHHHGIEKCLHSLMGPGSDPRVPLQVHGIHFERVPSSSRSFPLRFTRGRLDSFCGTGMLTSRPKWHHQPPKMASRHDASSALGFGGLMSEQLALEDIGKSSWGKRPGDSMRISPAVYASVSLTYNRRYRDRKVHSVLSRRHAEIRPECVEN